VSAFIDGFKEFIQRGNAIDIAVGVVVGGTFAKIVDSLLAGLISPLISATFGEPNLDAVGVFTINNANFSIGIILTALVNFLLISFALYTLIVVPMNKLRERQAAKAASAEEEVAADIALLTEIRDYLKTRES
jgi:large conductance mechanosensitive channel